MNVELLTSTQSILDMEDFAALAALTCHGNTDKDYVPADVLKHVIELGHESILEHINLTFSVEGLSRACLQELAQQHISLSIDSVRHTLKKYLKGDKASLIFDNIIEFHAVGTSMSNDELKYYLPEFWPTNLIITLNVHEFRHILNLRTASDALKEFQDLAHSMFHEVPEQFRYLLQDCVHEVVSNEK